MFCDLVGSTALSERLDPEELRELMREYQRLCGEVIERYQGYVAQHLGDGLLVYFGYPRAHEDDARRAALAGLDILRDIAAANESGTPRERIAVRIGIHTGPVVVGEIGHGAHTEQLALGATPNIAMRVQSLAEPGQLLISEATRRLSQGSVALRSLGLRALRGIEEPQELWQVLDQVDADQVSDANDATPFVGRVDELALLNEGVERFCNGSGELLLLEGEAGIGKSRLVDRLRSDHHERLTWLVCRCSSLHSNRPLHPVRGLLRKLMGGDTTDEAIHDWLAAWGASSVEAVAPTVAAVVRDGDRPASTDSGFNLHQVAPVLADLLALACSKRPALLVVEDAHWMDASTAEVMRALVKRVGNIPMGVLVTSRPDGVPELGAEHRPARILLGRFSARETEELISSSAAAELPAALQAQLASRCDGVPLFVEEVARMEVERFGSGAAEQNIPGTLRDLLAARLDAVGPARQTAQLAAVFGRSFDVAVLRRVVGDDLHLDADIETLEQAGIVTRQATGEAYLFRHALLQEVAYETTLRRERRRLHNLVVERVSAGDLSLAPDTLGWHLHRAERTEDAMKQYQLAARRALSAAAYGDSLALYRIALDVLRTLPESRERAASELQLLNDYMVPVAAFSSFEGDEMNEACSRVLELMPQLGPEQRRLALMKVWGMFCVNSDADRCDEVVGMLESDDFEPEFLTAGGITDFFAGRFGRGIQRMERYLDRGLRDERDGIPPNLLWNLFWAQGIAGRLVDAEVTMGLLREQCDRTNSQYLAVTMLLHWIWTLAHCGAAPEQILPHVGEADELAKRFEVPGSDGTVLLMKSWCAAMQGDRDALAVLSAAGSGDLGGENVASPSLRNLLAEAQIVAGEVDRAEGLLLRNERSYQQMLGRFMQSPGLRLQAAIAVQRGERVEAESLYRRGLELASSQQAPLFAYRCLLDAWSTLGDTPERRQEIDRAWNDLPQAQNLAALVPPWHNTDSTIG